MNHPKSLTQCLTVMTLLALLLGSALAVKPVSAADEIVVNSIVDGFSSSDGMCSLREAIHNANNAAQIYTGPGECNTGTTGADTITFAGDYTITVNSNLTITSDITITGNGALETIIQASACNPTIQSCSTNHNIFEVAQDGNLTLDRVTVRHGQVSSGGGILNQGTLTVMDSTLSANTAYSHGGGIQNFGSLSMTNSTLSGNTADWGGGITNTGTLTVTDSTLSGNTAANDGGGIFNIHLVTVTSSTLSGNTAVWGGGIWNSGEMMLTSSTLSGNIATFDEEEGGGGGGILNYYTVKYTNTIIADSFGGDCANIGGTIYDSTHNLVTDGSCGALLNADPMLAPLADNGGPTLTHALLPGSPAIDTGNNAFCPITDQRGVSRPQDGDLNGVAVCDIGAFEFVPDLFMIYLPLIVR